MDIGPIIIFGIIIPILIISIIVIASRTSNPFKFPYKRIYFNVSGNKSPNIKDYIDNRYRKK